MEEPVPGWVLDRSTEGLGLLVDDRLELGIVAGVRPLLANVEFEWIPVRVVYCRAERTSWRVGCQFLTKLAWRDLRSFG
jgi:hypothetical protein